MERKTFLQNQQIKHLENNEIAGELKVWHIFDEAKLRRHHIGWLHSERFRGINDIDSSWALNGGDFEVNPLETLGPRDENLACALFVPKIGMVRTPGNLQVFRFLLGF